MRALSRRSVLVGIGVGLALPAIPAIAQASRRIDVHIHTGSPAWIDAAGAKNLVATASLKTLKDYTAARMIEELDKAGTTFAMLSLTAPGTWMGDKAECVRLSRDANEFAAQRVAQYPKRFGFWATIPLPDVEASLKEIAYGLDTLKADGISVFTSYGKQYLGDKAFDPIFEELNRRKAIVFAHPGTAYCCTGLVPGIPDTVIEAQTDTTRAIAGYVFSGAAQRYPNIRMIFCHSAGTMPAVNERLVLLAKAPQYTSVVPDGFLAAVGKFYFDVATTTNVAALSAIRKLVAPSHLVFGTDFPFRGISDQVAALDASGVFTAAELDGIHRGNAVALVPRFA